MGGIISYIWPAGTMFWLLSGLLGFASLIVLAISISSLLYQLAELAEEYPTIAGIVIKKYILPIVFAIHILLWIDGLPFFACLIGLICHACYYWMLKTYPLIKLTSPSTIASLIAFIVCHYTWLQYFDEIGMNQRQNIPNAPGMGRVGILHMIGFFLLMVWIVPVGIFVTITVNDNVLPGISSDHNDNNNNNNNGSSDDIGKGNKTSNPFKAIYEKVHFLVDKITDRLWIGASAYNSRAMPSHISEGNFATNQQQQQQHHHQQQQQQQQQYQELYQQQPYSQQQPHQQQDHQQQYRSNYGGNTSSSSLNQRKVE
jgi:hypothetical protein